MLRKYSTIAIIILVVLFGGWRLARYFALRQINTLFDSRAPVQFKNVDLFLLGASADSATGYVGRLPVEIQNILCHASLGGLLSFSLNSVCTATFLGGTLQVQSSGLGLAGVGKSTLNTTLAGAQAQQYPLAMLAGIESGTFDVSVKDMRFSLDGKVNAGNVEFSIKNFSIPSQRKLKPPLVPLPITVPPLKHLDLTGLASIVNDNMDLQNFQLASSLGSIEGTGAMRGLSMGQAAALHIELQVSLSQTGIEQLQPWIDLVPGGRGTNGNFTLAITGQASNAHVALYK